MIFPRAARDVKLFVRNIAAGQQTGVPRRQPATRREEVTMSRIMRIALGVVTALGIAAAYGEIIWPR